jgi:hypothetical protein
MTTPVIPASNPTNQAAQGAVVYNSWWISQLSVQAQNPNGPVRVVAILKKYATVSGQIVFSPTDQPVTLVMPDLFGAANTDVALASAVDALITQVQAYGQSQHAI